MPRSRLIDTDRYCAPALSYSKLPARSITFRHKTYKLPGTKTHRLFNAKLKNVIAPLRQNCKKEEQRGTSIHCPSFLLYFHSIIFSYLRRLSDQLQHAPDILHHRICAGVHIPLCHFLHSGLFLFRRERLILCFGQSHFRTSLDDAHGENSCVFALADIGEGIAHLHHLVHTGDV